MYVCWVEGREEGCEKHLAAVVYGDRVHFHVQEYCWLVRGRLKRVKQAFLGACVRYNTSKRRPEITCQAGEPWLVRRRNGHEVECIGSCVGIGRSARI